MGSEDNTQELLTFFEGLPDAARKTLEKAFTHTIEAKDSDLEPEQIREIVPIREWLRSPFYNSMARNLYDYWVEEVAEFIEGEYNEWIITGCFSKSTKIRLLDGSTPTMEWLSHRYPTPEDTFWVYSIDAGGGIVPGKAGHCRKTGAQKEVWKVILDNGEEVLCTPDHRFLLLNGSYQRVDEIAPETPLMPLRLRDTSQGPQDKAPDGHERVYDPSTERYIATYSLVDHHRHPSFSLVRGKKDRQEPRHIVSAKFSHHEDVYDFEVEEHHNFALEAGVFVHNSIGTGKSTAALIAANRKLYELSCFKSPQRLFKLADITKIFFAYLSVNIKQAEMTGFGQFREMVDQTPYYQQLYTRDMKVRSILNFPGNTIFIPGSDQLSFIGTNLFGLVLDEINFLRAGPGGAIGNVNKAQEIYQEATDRRRSRFMYKGKDPGFSLLVSSSTVQTSFTMSRIKAAEQQVARGGRRTTKVTSTKLWEVKPKDTYSKRVFYVFNGSDREDAFLIENPLDLLDLIVDPIDQSRVNHAIEATNPTPRPALPPQSIPKDPTSIFRSQTTNQDPPTTYPTKDIQSFLQIDRKRVQGREDVDRDLVLRRVEKDEGLVRGDLSITKSGWILGPEGMDTKGAWVSGDYSESVAHKDLNLPERLDPAEIEEVASTGSLEVLFGGVWLGGEEAKAPEAPTPPSAPDPRPFPEDGIEYLELPPIGHKSATGPSRQDRALVEAPEGTYPPEKHPMAHIHHEADVYAPPPAGMQKRCDAKAPQGTNVPETHIHHEADLGAISGSETKCPVRKSTSSRGQFACNDTVGIPAGSADLGEACLCSACQAHVLENPEKGVSNEYTGTKCPDLGVGTLDPEFEKGQVRPTAIPAHVSAGTPPHSTPVEICKMLTEDLEYDPEIFPALFREVLFKAPDSGDDGLGMPKKPQDVLGSLGKAGIDQNDIDALYGNPVMDEIWEALPNYIQGAISRVPVDFRESFDGDLYSALKNIAGVSIAPAGKLFSSRSLWERALTVKIPRLLTRESFELTLKGSDAVLDYFKADLFFGPDGDPRRHAHAPRYLRVDQSKNHDCTGIACVHRAGWSSDTGIRMPMLEVDFVMRIEPPQKPDKIGFHKIRAFLIALRDMGLKIAQISFDQYQSEDHMQILELAGIKTAYQSVDRDDRAYLSMVNLLAEGRIQMADFPPVRKEFFNLDHDRVKGKVDHPKLNPDGSRGSKDAADALVGAVYACIQGIDVGVPDRGDLLAQVRTIGPNMEASRYEGGTSFDWVVPPKYQGKVDVSYQKVSPSLGYGSPEGGTDEDKTSW